MCGLRRSIPGISVCRRIVCRTQTVIDGEAAIWAAPPDGDVNPARAEYC
jgi:hypothetical protein